MLVEHQIAILAAKHALLEYTGMEMDPEQQEELAGWVQRNWPPDMIVAMRKEQSKMEAMSGK